VCDKLKQALDGAQRVVVIQAENPDGDSLGSALALEAILDDLGKRVSLHCPVDIPKYLRHLSGWDRVVTDFDTKADLAIVVDTVSDTLLSKTLEIPGVRHWLETHPTVAIDHHGEVESSLPFEHELIVAADAVATGEVLTRIAAELDWPISADAAAHLYNAIMSDSLGLSTPATTAESFRAAATLVDRGAVPADIENARRELMKKSPEILAYKGKLIERIEYHLDGKLAFVHIPWEEIQAYSDQYNPSVLVLDEMRLVEDVQIAVALKTYPDGKVTGKLRANSGSGVCEIIAGYFGGGGHPYASGFRVYDDYEKVKNELVAATDKALNNV
jgi:bifunctional oligoribonuclease and PAP phosphatase NrnA